MTTALLGALLFGAPQTATRLELIPPADGFIVGREDAVNIAALDSSGTLVSVAGAPAVTGAQGEPERLADGLWQVRVTPTGADVAVGATFAGVKGKLEAKAVPAPVLSMSLSATNLAPGVRGSVIALIDVKSSSGEMLDSITPVLTVTTPAGVVSPVPKRIGPGKWSAVIKMSDKKYPHTALVIASLPGRRETKAVAQSVALRGKGGVPIKTEANASVIVRVGGRAVGPLVADKYGALEAQVEAGPGDQTMEVEATDTAGNVEKQTLPLDMPKFPRFWAEGFAVPNGLDGRMRVSVRAFALDKRGNPASGADAPKAMVGTVPVPLEGKDGVYSGSALIALPPGNHSITVTGGDAEKKVFPFATPKAPGVGIQFVFTESTGKKNDGSVKMGGNPVTVTAMLVDGQGTPVAGAPAELFAEGVRITKVAAIDGRAAAKLFAIEGKIADDAIVGATAPGPGFRVGSRRAIVVTAGDPATVEVSSVQPPRLPADGESTSEVEAKVVDKWGNPVSGVNLASSATTGQVLSSIEPQPGIYRVVVRAPREPGAGNIGLTAGTVRAEASIAFMRPPPKWAVAVSAGGGTNLGALSTMTAALEGRRTIGRRDAPWAVVTRLAGSQGAFEVKEPGVGKWDVQVRQVNAQAGIRRRFTQPFSGWQLAGVVTGGAGSVEVAEKNAAGTEIDSGMLFGGRLALSAERVLGGGALVVESGYSHLTAESDVIKGNLGGAEVTVGYRHGF